MAIKYGDRIHRSVLGSIFGGSRIRKKTSKKKRRRNARASCNDGHERKSAGSLSPALKTSKQILRESENE